MAIKTISHSTGKGTWSEGWHTLTIGSAEYGDWNGKRFLDVLFEGYPETFNLRVYEGINNETREEFAISKFFKMANAGIIDVIASPDGKKAIQYDDEADGLVGKVVNVLFVKEERNDKTFMKPFNQIAPIAQDGDVISYSEDDVNFWKKVSEENHAKYTSKSSTTSNTSSHTNNAEPSVPF
tara:strand:+ start:1912 stop:2454 length:543 start_codon:yes stop_codon:yes gene_type:complete